MRNNIAKLIKLDENIEESRVLKIGETVIETFDSYGKFYPLSEGKNYEVRLQLVQFDPVPPTQVNDSYKNVEQINNTFEYFLCGNLVDGKFYVGDIVFDDNYLKTFSNFNNSTIKHKVDRIIVEFISEVG